MELLFVVPYVPNLVRVRPYNLIRSLVGRGHKITLVTLWSAADEKVDLENLISSGVTVEGASQSIWRSLANCVPAVLSGEPLQAWFSWNQHLAHQIEFLTRGDNGKRKFDAVHIEHLRGVKYGQTLNKIWTDKQNANGRRVPIVWDSVDSISHLFRQSAARSVSWKHRLIARLEVSRTEAFEGKMARSFSRVLITSEKDKRALVALAKDPDISDCISVIPNGVDHDYFYPNEQIVRDANSIVVSGKMSYHANSTMVMHLANNIMPLIWAKRPETRLVIAGKDPSKEIRALAENPQVIVTGTVADIRPYLQKATLAAAPLIYGAGIQNKVLESMACGTPVIASELAVSALQAKAGQEICVAQSVEEFAEQAIGLLENAEFRTTIGSAGRDYVLRNHHWERIAERLEGVYDAINRTDHRICA